MNPQVDEDQIIDQNDMSFQFQRICHLKLQMWIYCFDNKLHKLFTLIEWEKIVNLYYFSLCYINMIQYSISLMDASSYWKQIERRKKLVF